MSSLAARLPPIKLKHFFRAGRSLPAAIYVPNELGRGRITRKSDGVQGENRRRTEPPGQAQIIAMPPLT
jgi:hypothetical protein